MYLIRIHNKKNFCPKCGSNKFMSLVVCQAKEEGTSHFMCGNCAAEYSANKYLKTVRYDLRKEV